MPQPIPQQMPAAPQAPAQQHVSQPISAQPGQNVVPFNTVQPGQNPSNGSSLTDLVYGQRQQQAPAPQAQQAPQSHGLSPDTIAHIARIEAENAALRVQQGQSQRAGNPEPAAPAPTYNYLDPVEIPQELVSALGNVYDPVTQIADARFQQSLNPLLQTMNERDANIMAQFQSITERMDQMRETMFNNDLANVAPDITRIKNHPNAREYFAQTSVDGRSYADMLADAEKANDVQRIGRITEDFKRWDAQRNQTQTQQVMTQPFQQHMPHSNAQVQQPQHQPVDNPFYQPSVGQGDQAQSFNPSVPANPQQGAVNFSDFSQKQEALNVAYMKAMQSGDKAGALEINEQREQLAMAAMTAMEQGQIVPA